MLTPIHPQYDLTGFACPERDSRPDLTGVNFSTRHVEATNGSIAVRIPHREHEIPLVPAFVPTALLKQAMKASIKHVPVALATDPATPTVIVGPNHESFPVTPRDDMKAFPSDALGQFYAPREDKFQISLGADLLLEIAKHAQRHGLHGKGFSTGCVITFRCVDKLKPARFSYQLESGQSLEGVLMPYRTE